MANVVARRLINRNLFKFKEFANVSSSYPVANCLLLQLNQSHSFTGNCNQWNSMDAKLLEPPKFVNSSIQLYSKSAKDDDNDEKKLTLFQRFKQMYKEYWYVLLPVHVVTSAAWFGGFYYLAKSGVDIIAILESWNVSDKIVNPLRDSSMGYIAVSYALYKIATPARYTVTLGGTTISINYLKKWGYIKPVPSRERLKEMYQEKKDDLMEAMRETRDGLKSHSEKLKEKKEDMMEDLDKSIKEIGSKIKKHEHVMEECKKGAKK